MVESVAIHELGAKLHKLMAKPQSSPSYGAERDGHADAALSSGAAAASGRTTSSSNYNIMCATALTALFVTQRCVRRLSFMGSVLTGLPPHL